MSGAVCDMTAPHIPAQLHPVGRTRCQGCGGHSWQWHDEGLWLMTPDSVVLLWREGADEDNIPFRTWLQTCCPRKSVSLYIPIIDHSKKVSPFGSKKASRQTKPSRQCRGSGRYLWRHCNRSGGLWLRNWKSKGCWGCWMESGFQLVLREEASPCSWSSYIQPVGNWSCSRIKLFLGILSLCDFIVFITVGVWSRSEDSRCCCKKLIQITHL